jgi:hypothetical protein
VNESNTRGKLFYVPCRILSATNDFRIQTIQVLPMINKMHFLRKRYTCWLVFLTFLLLAAVLNADETADGVKSPAEPAKDVQPNFDGKDLSGWRIINKQDFGKHGEIGFAKGVVSIAAGSPASGIAWKGKTATLDYEVTLQARRMKGGDFFCGITFPYKKAYSTLVLGGWGGGTTGLSNVDGFSAIENDTTDFIEFKNETWYTVRLKVTEKLIEAWVDKKKIVEQDTEGHKFSIWWEQEPVMPFGIATWNTGAEIRNLKFTKLKGEVQAKK